MHSSLTIAAYRYLLLHESSSREEDVAVQQILHDSLAPPTSDRFDALKAAVRRKRKRPTSLSPLDVIQHSHSPEKRDESDDDETDDQSTAYLPQSPSRLVSSPRASLPPLEVQVLQRKKLFLSPYGEPVIGIEEIIQLQEQPTSPPKFRSPMQLIAIPRKVFEEDEVALMPCHTLHYRSVPSLAVEKWKEPLRDRDKNWRDDELSMILTTQGTMRHSHAQSKMTRSHGTIRKGTWRRLDSQRLQVKTATGAKQAPLPPVAEVAATTAAVPPRDAALPSEVLLRSQGAMISNTYCIITIFGIGIYGRLYGEGLADRTGHDRYLRVDAYDPRTSAVASLRVSLNDLEWVFEANPELLAAGKKQLVLKKVISLLFFQYPDEDSKETKDGKGRVASLAFTGPPLPPLPPVDIPQVNEPAILPTEAAPVPPALLPPTETAPLVKQQRIPVLCISPTEQLNESARRRLERDERLRMEEQERLRLLALLMKLPRRARHRVACKLHRVSGHEFLISIYHFPNQVRNFLITAYHARTSRTLSVAMGVMEAASMCRILTMPHQWAAAQKREIALALVPKLHLRATKWKALPGDNTFTEADLYRVSLAVREDRMGAQGARLPLPLAVHDGARKDEIIAKYKKDGQQEQQLLLEKQIQMISTETSAKTEKLHRDIHDSEATIKALKAKDEELKELIEEIDGGKGMPAAASALANISRAGDDKKQHQEARRGHKAARKTIKDEGNALQARVVAWKRELELTREHDLMEREKAQSKYDKAVDALTQQATTATLRMWFDPRDRKERGNKKTCAVSNGRKNGQRAVLIRCEIHDDMMLMVSGACRVSGKMYRYSVFAELPSRCDAFEDGEETVEEPTSWFQVVFYDPLTGGSLTLRLTRLEWISFTKTSFKTQLEIAAFGIPTSPIVQQVKAIDIAYETTRRTLSTIKKLKKNEKKREKMMKELTQNRHEINQIKRCEKPWQVIVKTLTKRLSVVVKEPSKNEELEIDRCIYRATLGVVLLAHNTTDNSNDDEDDVVDCDVSVRQEWDFVCFHARQISTGESCSLAYPDSAELVKEFEVESYLEQQMHLEAIAMTLLLYTEESGDGNPRGIRKMRFEE